MSKKAVPCGDSTKVGGLSVVDSLDMWLTEGGIFVTHHPEGLRTDDFRKLGDPSDQRQKNVLTKAAGTVSRYLCWLESHNGGISEFARVEVDGLVIPYFPRGRIEELAVVPRASIPELVGLGAGTQAILKSVLAHTLPIPMPGSIHVPEQSLHLNVQPVDFLAGLRNAGGSPLTLVS